MAEKTEKDWELEVAALRGEIAALRKQLEAVRNDAGKVQFASKRVRTEGNFVTPGAEYEDYR